MKDSTKRALRTLFDVVTGAAVAIPVAVGAFQANVPLEGTVAAALATTVAVAAAVAKIVNALEDAGVIPAWLKGDTDE